MREVRILTDDRDRDPEDRTELVLQHAPSGDLYVTTVQEGKPAMQGVRLATSGGAGYAIPDLVFGLMEGFHQIIEKAAKDPAWAKNHGIKVSL